MRALLAGAGGLTAALLIPLLLIAALLGSLPAATTGGDVTAAQIGDLTTPAAYVGASTGCTSTDPTGGRCLTPATRHAHDELTRAFGPPGPNSAIRSAGCWDAHAWNPTSDHPLGRACDYFPGRAGTFPQGQELQNGWRMANWLRAHADTLKVKYIIWQGRIWSAGGSDLEGWGRPYTGGGVYDATDATGGHFDHIHLSIAT